MLKQTFTIILEIPYPFDQGFPKVEAERMANIIRDGVIAKSCSFAGPVPFTIRCSQGSEVALAPGQMREYSPELLEESQRSCPMTSQHHLKSHTKQLERVGANTSDVT